MRNILIAAIAVAGIGLLGTSSTFAAPASGSAIRDIATATSSVQDVRTCVWKYRHGPHSRRDRWKHCW
jgi:hypothetical protein